MCKNLTDKFKIEDISWKVLTCKWNNGKPWALLTPYVNASAIQSRLDELFDFDGWKTEYVMNNQYVNCRLSIWSDKRNQWITKENTCEVDDPKQDNSPNNPYKTACSGAFKRVALEFGIGRYLKNIKCFAKNVCESPDDKTLYLLCTDKKSNKIFYASIPTEKEILELIEIPENNNKVPEKDKELPEKPTELSNKEIEPTKNNKDLISQETAIQITKFIKSKFSENEGKVILGIRRAFNISDFKELTKQQHEIIINCQFDIEKIKKAV